jgi:hypothetical protein
MTMPSASPGIKLHTLLDLRGSIFSFIAITEAKLHDVNILDRLVSEPGAPIRPASSPGVLCDPQQVQYRSAPLYDRSQDTYSSTYQNIFKPVSSMPALGHY